MITIRSGWPAPVRHSTLSLPPPDSLGGYGYVFVAQDSESGKEYALKVLYMCAHLLYMYMYVQYEV